MASEFQLTQWRREMIKHVADAAAYKPLLPWRRKRWRAELALRVNEALSKVLIAENIGLLTSVFREADQTAERLAVSRDRADSILRQFVNAVEDTENIDPDAIGFIRTMAESWLEDRGEVDQRFGEVVTEIPKTPFFEAGRKGMQDAHEES